MWHLCVAGMCGRVLLCVYMFMVCVCVCRVCESIVCVCMCVCVVCVCVTFKMFFRTISAATGSRG